MVCLIYVHLAYNYQVVLQMLSKWGPGAHDLIDHA